MSSGRREICEDLRTIMCEFELVTYIHIELQQEIFCPPGTVRLSGQLAFLSLSHPLTPSYRSIS